MDQKAPIHSLLHHLSASEKLCLETRAFFSAFNEALAAEQQIAKKVKDKVHEVKRCANRALHGGASKSAGWKSSIQVARAKFVEMRFAEHCQNIRQEFRGIFKEWHRASHWCRCQLCNREILRSEFHSHTASASCQTETQGAPKDGKCHLVTVPYPALVGILLPMLTYRELLPLTSASRKQREAAEDGCAWMTQMSRHYPLSALRPGAMKHWKHIFLCELNQAVASLECFHTKKNLIANDAIVLGIPIEFTINPRTQATDHIYSSMDLLSHEAFSIDRVRKTVYKEDFTHWLPMYLNEHHWERALPYVKRAIPQLLPHRCTTFQPEQTLEVFAKMVNTLVVLVCDKGIAFSERAAKAYCQLHRWALRCIEEWPDLQRYVDARVDKFCCGEGHRSKDAEPSLGEFMPLLLVSSRPWSRVSKHVLHEWLDRQVLWLCTEHPGLASLSGRAAPTDDERVKQSWEASLVSKRLYAFHVNCFTLSKHGRSIDDITREYDTFYGQPSRHTLGRFHDCVHAALDVSDWSHFFKLVHVTEPPRAMLLELLRNAVRNSRRRGYHRDGMDFNRVHASGTSKILRKGESYMAAATLKAVDLEEHWSWSDGDTKYLDATCLVYDCSHEYLGVLDYNHTTMTSVNGKHMKAGVLQHSGDQLDLEKQSGQHTIHVDLSSLPMAIQYLYIAVSSWNGATLSHIRQPSVRLMGDGREELCRYNVDAADGQKTAILMCVLHRRVERSTAQTSRWALEAIGDVGNGAADNYGPMLETIEKFRKLKKW